MKWFYPLSLAFELMLLTWDLVWCVWKKMWHVIKDKSSYTTTSHTLYSCFLNAWNLSIPQNFCSIGNDLFIRYIFSVVLVGKVFIYMKLLWSFYELIDWWWSESNSKYELSGSIVLFISSLKKQISKIGYQFLLLNSSYNKLIVNVIFMKKYIVGLWYWIYISHVKLHVCRKF